MRLPRAHACPAARSPQAFERAQQPAILPMAPSDSARRPPGCARRPSDARSAERGVASSRRCLPACASAAGIRLQPLRAQLRLRRPSDARSAERGARRGRRETCACRSTPSQGSLRLPRGGEARHRARRCTQVRRRTVVSNCALPTPRSPEPPPLRPSPFRPSPQLRAQLSPPGLARAGSWLPWPIGCGTVGTYWGRRTLVCGFLWCMTWSMAAMGIRTRDRTRMSNAGAVAASAASAGKRARELKNVYAANV